MTDILNDVVRPLEAALEGKPPDHALAGLTFIVASILYQTLMPKIGNQEIFDGAMELFKKQVQDDLVMLIEENKGK